MNKQKPVVGCVRLTPTQWQKLRALWHVNGGMSWMDRFINREWRKAVKSGVVQDGAQQ